MKKNFLHFQHRRHSGSVLHHRHTSYRAMLAVLLLAGAFMIWIANYVSTVDSQLKSQVSQSAPLPDKIPFITSPVIGAEVTDDNIEVVGTCSNNTKTYVIIYNSLDVVGSVVCSSTGTFSVSVPAEYGVNKLSAVATNINNQTTSRSVEVTVNRAGTVDSNSVGIKVQNPVVHYKTGEEFIWTIATQRGAEPITGKINWGDSQSQDASLSSSTLELKHIYKDNETRTINVAVKDNAGVSKNYMFVADDITGYVSPIGSTTSSTSSAIALGGKSAEFIRIIVFSLYALLVISIVLFVRQQRFAPEIITLPEDFDDN